MILPPLIKGTLIKRYKRFLSDVRLESGEKVTAFTPNTGSMMGCSQPESPVRLSFQNNPNRKYSHTLELVYANNTWVGVNTNVPNILVREAIEQGVIPELAGYDTIRPEVRYGENSRIDLLLSRGDDPCYVEVKNVTLVRNGVAAFPDAVTARGAKHLRELVTEIEKGNRGVMVYIVQREDGTVFRPAEDIDPFYVRTLRQALNSGIEMLAYQARVNEKEITVRRKLPIEIDFNA